jgi:hypothetical protein
MAEVVESLPSKYKDLSSTPVTFKKVISYLTDSHFESHTMKAE